MSVYDYFVRKHDFLVCIDSDGCAMDTMHYKHIHCFGPCVVDEWGLEPWREEVLHCWNDINLFQMTRGMNRFKALAIALSEINDKYTPIVGVEVLRKWVETTRVLSEETLEKAIAETENADGFVCLQKTLLWSQAVNDCIARLPEELRRPFSGVKEALAAASEVADIAIVSNANREAVEEEWEKHGLLEYADVLLTQDCASKASCIRWMLKFGYQKDQVLMVGDAPADCDAAEENGVWFYPILVNWEEESWAGFYEEALELFVTGRYDTCQTEKKQVFIENLGG